MGTHIELPLLFSKAKAQEKEGDALILNIIAYVVQAVLCHGFESLTDRNNVTLFRNIGLILRILGNLANKGVIVPHLMCFMVTKLFPQRLSSQLNPKWAF